MLRALLVIFDPTATWDRILRVRRGVVFILITHLLPLLLIVSACEAYGLVYWGKWQGVGFVSLSKMQPQVAHLKQFPVSEAVVVEAAQVLLALVVVFVGAKLVKSIGETFHGRHTYTQAFTAVAYSLGPLFLLRCFDAFSGIYPLVTWGIGIALSIAALYQGVPRAMEPDPAHAFGVYLVSAVLLTLVTGLARFVTAIYLEGGCPQLEAAISGLTARLPF